MDLQELSNTYILYINYIHHIRIPRLLPFFPLSSCTAQLLSSPETLSHPYSDLLSVYLVYLELPMQCHLSLNRKHGI